MRVPSRPPKDLLLAMPRAAQLGRRLPGSGGATAGFGRLLSLLRQKYDSAKLKAQVFGAPGHTAQRLLASSNSLLCLTFPAPRSARLLLPWR